MNGWRRWKTDRHTVIISVITAGEKVHMAKRHIAKNNVILEKEQQTRAVNPIEPSRFIDCFPYQLFQPVNAIRLTSLKFPHSLHPRPDVKSESLMRDTLNHYWHTMQTTTLKYDSAISETLHIPELHDVIICYCSFPCLQCCPGSPKSKATFIGLVAHLVEIAEIQKWSCRNMPNRLETFRILYFLQIPKLIGPLLTTSKAATLTPKAT